MNIVITRREALDIPDGINAFIFALADELLSRGHAVSVISSTASDVATIKKYFEFERYPDVISLPRGGSSTTRLPALRYFLRSSLWMWRGRARVEALAPDLVIVNGAVPVTFPGISCTVSHDLERRHVTWDWPRLAYKRLTYRRSDLVVATCSEIRDALAGQLRMSEHEIKVIPTCISQAGYRNESLVNREPWILHMGTPAYKNPSASVAAFGRLSRPDARLLVTGRPTAALEDALDRLDPSVRARVELLGWVTAENLKDLLGKVRVVSVPSRYHAPVASPTVLEAFASGTPVLGTDGITADLLIDRANGLRRDPNDTDAWADAYEALLADQEAWGRMSHSATETARRFSAANVADAYLSLLESSKPAAIETAR